MNEAWDTDEDAAGAVHDEGAVGKVFYGHEKGAARRLDFVVEAGVPDQIGGDFTDLRVAEGGRAAGFAKVTELGADVDGLQLQVEASARIADGGGGLHGR